MILVLGSTGQVGRALMGALASRSATFLGRAEADLADPEALYETLRAMPTPRAVINAAAYTAVDKAEEEEALATLVNARAPDILAHYCLERGIPLVHYSTDYVFDGSGAAARDENAATAPLNAYGRSKLAGEQAIEASGCGHLILRTSWVYDAEGKNFFTTMLRLGAEREQLRVVADQWGAPSYAPHLAEATVAALDGALKQAFFPSGLYHFCHAGETSWHAFAEAIFAGARSRGAEMKVTAVEAIGTAEYPTPAKRPLNSRLDCTKLAKALDVRLPSWQEGLTACLEARYADH